MKIQYKIVSGTATAVAEQVSNLLNSGWELNGGISVVEHTIPNAVNPEEKLLLIYTQGMIKKD